MKSNVKAVSTQFKDLMQHFNREVQLIGESKENEMYISIILSVIVINTDFQREYINMSEIASISLTDTEEDGGLLSFTLKGNPEEVIIGCTSLAAWKNAKEWFKDNEHSIIEGMTKEKEKDKKKTRF